MRNYKIFFVIVILSLVVFQFQNCGTPPNGYDTSSYANSDFDPGLIDDLPNRKLVFVESLVVSKHNYEKINYDGLCSQDSHGEVVKWVVENTSTREVFFEGETECIRGGFRVTIDKMLNIECGVEYELIPFMGEFEDRVLIKRKCEPVVSIDINDGNDERSYNNPNIIQKSCFYELEEGTDNKTNTDDCFKVCYMSGKLYDRTEVEAAFCENE